MEIKYDFEPSGNCPVQSEGTIGDKYAFYFRARGEAFSIYIAPIGKCFFDDAVFNHSEEYNGIVAQSNNKRIGDKLYTAGWAHEDECKAYIERQITAFIQGLESPQDAGQA